MTHKISHHLGLCDHYREMAGVGENLESDSSSRSAAERQKQFDYRVTAAPDNVMSNEAAAFGKAELAVVVKSGDCPPAPDRNKCKNQMFSAKQSGSYPSGFPVRPTDISMSGPADIFHDKERRPSLIFSTILPGGSSLLAPAQFRTV